MRNILSEMCRWAFNLHPVEMMIYSTHHCTRITAVFSGSANFYPLWLRAPAWLRDLTTFRHSRKNRKVRVIFIRYHVIFILYPWFRLHPLVSWFRGQWLAVGGLIHAGASL